MLNFFSKLKSKLESLFKDDSKNYIDSYKFRKKAEPVYKRKTCKSCHFLNIYNCNKNKNSRACALYIKK